MHMLECYSIKNSKAFAASNLAIKSVWRFNCCVCVLCPLSCSYLKTPPCFLFKHSVFDTGYCLRLQVKPAQLVMGISSVE
jgi:hypothetical protein